MKNSKSLSGKDAYTEADANRGFIQPPEPDFSETSTWEITNNDARTGSNMPLKSGEGVK